MKKTIYKILLLFVSLCAILNIGLSSFLISENKSNISINIKPSDEKAVCYTLSDNRKFASLEKGLEVANSRGNETLVLCNNCEVSKDLTVNDGVTLILPYDDGGNTVSFVKTASSSALKYQLFIKNSSTLTIAEGGSIIVGGVLSQTGIKGDYSQILLDSNCNIVVNGNASIYGKIKENKPINGFDKNIYDNSLDKDRFFKVSSTGNLTTSFATYDLPTSGSALANAVDQNVCPTYNFDFPCIQTYLTIEYGGSLDAVAYSSWAEVKMEAGVIYPSDMEEEKDSIFYCSQGDVNIEYSGSKKTLIYLNGQAKIGSLYLPVQSGIAIDSNKFFLPLSNYFKIFINGAFSTNGKMIKFLPGSYLKVLENSEFLIEGSNENNISKVIFYKGNTLSSIGITKYGNSDSVLINNGTIKVNQYGMLAGYITTENTNGEAIIDFSEISSSSSLAFSTREQNLELNTPIIECQGPFLEQAEDVGSQYDALFLPNEIYKSMDGNAFWEGNVNRSYNISLNVSDIGSHNQSFLYSIYKNTKSSDDGLITLFENVNNVRTQNFIVNNDEYIKIIDENCDKILVNGIEYNSGEWIKVSSDMNIEIVPLPAYVITCFHTSGTTGAGSISRTIYYGKTEENVTQFNVSTQAGQRITAYIPQGWYFKVEDSSWVKGTSKVTKTTYDEDWNKTTTVLNETSGKLAWDEKTIYVADGDYEFTSDNVNCFSEGTEIMLADGTYKKIEEITYDDKVLTWNFFEGKFEPQNLSIIVNHGKNKYEVINLHFKNGKELQIIGEHGAFNWDLNKFVYINKYNISDFINTRFAFAENGQIEITELVSFSAEIKYVNSYSITSAFNFNVISEGVLTAPPPEDLYNWVPMCDKMLYDVKEFNDDVLTYGLYDYSYFEPYGISYKTFIEFNGPYLKIPVEKGLFSFDYIIEQFELYKEFIEI